MKLVRPTHKQPANIVQFICSMEMTKHDIKNYLEKIYDVKTVDVRTRIAMGKTRRDMGHGYVVKDDDVKYVYAVLVRIFWRSEILFYFLRNCILAERRKI